MLAVFDITFPIFALIGLGYLMTRGGRFGQRDIGTLGTFTMDVALPALILNAMTSRPLGQIIDPGYLIDYSAATLAAMALTFGTLTLLGIRGPKRSLAIMGGSCANSGFIGYPILMLAYPAFAGTVLAHQVMIENFLAVPVVLLMAEGATPRLRTEPWRLIRDIARNIVRRPVIQMVVLGAVLNIAGITLPSALSRAIELLAATASAIALFYIGGVLAGLTQHTRDSAMVAVVVAMKLLAMPALACGIALALPHFGLPAISPELLIPMVISAAIPSMTMYPIISRDYGEEQIAAIALMVATVLSFFTLSALLMMVHPAAF